MDQLTAIAAWIAGHETLLSGLAAIVAVVGVVLTPIGFALRRRHDRARMPALGESPAAESAGSAGRHGASAGRPSIAVLPFLNLSEDREQEFLADGMTEDLLTGLAASRHLSVVSRNSSFAYKGRSPDVRDVGRELGVRYVLEGSVRRIGDRVRTTAQLIDAATGEHLWAEKYDRGHAQMHDEQDEVVASIAGALSAQLWAAESRRVDGEDPRELGAWERLQVVWSAFSTMNSAAMSVALDQLREAVEQDPNYGYARSALAWLLHVAIINGLVDDIPGTAAEARPHLAAALESANDDPLTLFYAGAALVYAGRHRQGNQTLRRSLELNPHQPDVYMHLGMAACQQGEFDEAHRCFDRAEALAPSGGMSSGYSWYRTFSLGFEERFEEAVALLESLLPGVPRYATPRVMLGLYLDALGRCDEARACIERAARENPGLNVDGLSLLVGAHPDVERGAARVKRFREYWPVA